MGTIAGEKAPKTSSMLPIASCRPVRGLTKHRCESLGVNTETSPQFSLAGTSTDAFLKMGRFEMRITLTDEQHLMLELIADKPLPAIPEIARYTGVLAAARLIELTAKVGGH